MTKNKIQRAERESLNIRDKLLEVLRASTPEIFAEGRVNWHKLRQVLGERLETSADKFNFKWAGKAQAITNVLIPSKATLRPLEKESVKFDTSENIFIEGDNLEVLKLLQKSYFEQIKMIYIDPPYNTGNDFVYKDDFRQPSKNYLEQSGQVDSEGNRLSTNTQVSGRFHSNWLTMMYSRLKLAWNLLRPDGVIFVSIDDNEVHHLKMLMNEIYGEECFISTLTILCNPKGRSQDKYFATNHEYVMVYGKTVLPKGSFSIEKDEAQIEDEYPKEDEIGKYRLLELRNTHREFGRHNRKNLSYPLFVDTNNGNVSLGQDRGNEKVLPIWDDGYEGCWTWNREKVQKDLSYLTARNIKGQWKIFRKNYASGADRMLKTILSEKEFHTEKGQKAFNRLFKTRDKIFQSPKSVELISLLASTVLGKDDIIMDFFAGSATTAHAILAQNQEDGGNRKFIMVQLPEATDHGSIAYKAGYKTVADIAKERIRRVLKGYDNYEAIDDGFKVFKLGKSNYYDNLFEYDPEKSTEEKDVAFKNYLSNAQKGLFPTKINETDIVYENIIKEGLSLNAKIEEVKIRKNKTYKVMDGERELLVCLDEKLNDSTIEFLMDKNFKEKIFICFDVALSDSDKANLSLNLTLKTI